MADLYFISIALAFFVITVGREVGFRPPLQNVDQSSELSRTEGFCHVSFPMMADDAKPYKDEALVNRPEKVRAISHTDLLKLV